MTPRPFSQFFAWAERRPSQSPGVGTYAFLPLDLPLQTPIGAGVANRQQLKVFQGAIVDYNQMVPVAGLGGLQMGQAIAPPLADPELSL